MSTIHVTYDGDTHWLECFAADLNAEHGEIIHPIDAGDKWDDVAALVRAHQAEHGCSGSASPAPELAAAMAESRQLRALVAEILDAFGPSGSGHTARVGQVQIAKWCVRAGLDGRRERELLAAARDSGQPEVTG